MSGECNLAVTGQVIHACCSCSDSHFRIDVQVVVGFEHWREGASWVQGKVWAVWPSSLLGLGTSSNEWWTRRNNKDKSVTLCECHAEAALQSVTLTSHTKSVLMVSSTVLKTAPKWPVTAIPLRL